MTLHPETEAPRYFGAGHTLFGIFHRAATPAQKAVLLCPPLGQDQIRCHRLYRQLANALAAAGIPVLRFDYYGTGDSIGGSADISWPRCIEDIATAASELRTLAGCERIVAFGTRLGGSLSLAAALPARFTQLIMWDPVLDGAAHVGRLDDLQLRLSQDPMRFIKPRSPAEAAGQWLGFPFDDRFRQQLLALRAEPASVPTLMLRSSATTAASDDERFSAAGATTVTLQNPTAWDELDRLELAIVSHELIHAVNDFLKGVS
jgi:pimeloyl-ACP methyl ester carboxylesterase